MAHDPEFMRRFDEFQRERAQIRSVGDWHAFRQRWFDSAAWPRKTPQQIAADGRHKVGPVRLGGRLWGFTSWAYDLSPEARYEYFLTLRNIADPLRFPDDYKFGFPVGRGWQQECPYDEIATSEIGHDECPKCGRKLVLSRAAD